MRTPRKDMFVSIYALVWGVTDMVLYFAKGMDATMFSNFVFIILLVAVLMCSPLMRWLNKK